MKKPFPFTYLLLALISVSGVLWACGSNTPTSTSTTATPTPAPTPYVNLGIVTTLAGNPGVSGEADGLGSSATFFRPRNLVIDSSGNIFVSDHNNSAIRKVTPAGLVTTFAGSTTAATGTTDGTGTAARFTQPNGLAFDSLGNLFVADYFCIRKITPAAVVSTFAGTCGTSGYLDATGTAARFSSVAGIAIDSSSNLFITEYGGRDIRKITPAGVVSTFAGQNATLGYSDNPVGTSALFQDPYGIAIDANNVLYVVDEDNFVIRKITAAGAVTTFAGLGGTSGNVNGTGSAARFADPLGIAIDLNNGNLYVADQSSANSIRQITSAGVVSTLAGSSTTGTMDGTGAAAQFNLPYGVAVNSAGVIYVGDQNGQTIRMIR